MNHNHESLGNELVKLQIFVEDKNHKNIYGVAGKSKLPIWVTTPPYGSIPTTKHPSPNFKNKNKKIYEKYFAKTIIRFFFSNYILKLNHYIKFECRNGIKLV